MMQVCDEIQAPLDRHGDTNEAAAMPIYDYRCDECLHCFEVLVRGKQKVACPQCASARLEKLLSLTARPSTGNERRDQNRPIPPSGGGCCGGGCGSHSH
jgi:putative FmdB family regulatory protein